MCFCPLVSCEGNHLRNHSFYYFGYVCRRCRHYTPPPPRGRLPDGLSSSRVRSITTRPPSPPLRLGLRFFPPAIGAAAATGFLATTTAAAAAAAAAGAEAFACNTPARATIGCGMAAPPSLCPGPATATANTPTPPTAPAPSPAPSLFALPMKAPTFRPFPGNALFSCTGTASVL